MMTSFQILHDLGVKNSLMIPILHMNDNQINEECDAYERELGYLAHEREIRKDILDDFEDVFTNDEIREIQLEYLELKFNEVNDDFHETCIDYAKLLRMEPRLGYWHRIGAERLERELKKIKHRMQILKGKKESITPEDVAHARTYPIEEIVQVNKAHMASCPFHDDKKPSMDTRKNFYHCYSCGESGDMIDLVMKLEGVTFPEAVKRLTL